MFCNLVASLLLVAMSGVPGSFLFLAVRPGAPSGVLASSRLLNTWGEPSTGAPVVSLATSLCAQTPASGFQFVACDTAALVLWRCDEQSWFPIFKMVRKRGIAQVSGGHDLHHLSCPLIYALLHSPLTQDTQKLKA